MKQRDDLLNEVKDKLSNRYYLEQRDQELVNDCIDELLKAINYSQCCESDSKQLKDKVKMTFDEYTEKFYISNGFTYESKKTGKLADINEITERYRWFSKNL